MKILFLTNLYPPNVFGGYERLCFQVASMLHARGHEVTVLTSSYGQSAGKDYGYCVRRELFLSATEGNIYEPFDCSPSQREVYQATNRSRFEAVLAEVTPEILFVWNLYFFDGGLLTAVENSKFPKAYLLTDNWMIAQLNGQFIGEYFQNKVFGGVAEPTLGLRRLKRMAKEVVERYRKRSFLMKGRAIFPSRFMRQLYRDAGFRFEAGEAVCYHGVEFRHLPDARRRERRELVAGSEVRLLFAGRVVSIKGVHTAIEALRIAREKNAGMRVLLTIVGDTQDKGYLHELEKLIDSLGLCESIVFQPSVAEERMFDLFQEHDIYLFPSLYEPFSLTLILALESGIPTISSDVGGNVEIVHNGRTGMTFRAGDSADLARKIGTLMEDGRLREALSQAAVVQASSFTFESMIARIESDLLVTTTGQLNLPAH